MRASIFNGLSLATLLLLLGCSTMEIQSDYDTGTDFSTLRSYAWLDDRSAVEGGEKETRSLLDQRIRRAVEQTLLEKGHPKVPQDQASFLVSYHVGVDRKLDVHTIHHGYGYGYGGRGYYHYGPYWGPYWGGYSDTRIREYDEGTLLIDFIDPERRELLWRGSAQARVEGYSKPAEREERVRKAVAKILEQFPPET
jgi:hypothetical protein